MNKKKLIIVLSITAVVIAGAFIGMKIRDDRLPRYTVSFDANGGTQIDSIEVKQGYKIPKPEDPIKNGYHVKNWEYQDKAWVFDSDVVRNDMTLTATWDYDNYVITYNFDGGTYDGGYKTTYDIDTEFALIRPTKQGNIFGGWFDEKGNRIDEIIKGMTGDLILTAKWLDNLVIINADESQGSILTYVDEKDPTLITVEFIPTNHKYHLFSGWYNNVDSLLSSELSYTFSIDSEQTTQISVKYISQNEENEWNIKHGVLPSLNEESGTVNYGMYPQSNINDIELIEKLEKTTQCDFNNFYYYGSDYYFKKSAKLYPDMAEQIHNFDNGEEIIEGADYWFKVEPISWRILKNDSSNYFLMTEKLLDVVLYYKNASTRTIDGQTIHPNNYKYSDLRKWLNEDFLDKAFYFNREYILQTEVDNSASTTVSMENIYACENTVDYVFELSYQDYINEEYGFVNNLISTETRSFITTDLARASYALYDTVSNLYHGYKWTRSPFYSNEDNKDMNISRISRGGVINHCWCGANYSCAQPCIIIKMGVS